MLFERVATETEPGAQGARAYATRHEAPRSASKDEVRGVGLAHVDVRTAEQQKYDHARENGTSGVVTLLCGEREVSPPQELSGRCDCGRHVSIAAARSVRCVWADVRWRWTLNVL